MLRTIETRDRSFVERAASAWKGASVVGVVMEREECNGRSRGANCTASHAVASQLQMSSRMKNLLHGVRLSVVSEDLNPANDLDELARRIDAARRGRNNGGNA